MADHIRSKVLLGEYGPDGRLVGWRIAWELGVSRTPVRQALTTVKAEGSIATFPNRGADEVRNVYDLRAYFEGLGARRAADRVGDAAISSGQSS